MKIINYILTFVFMFGVSLSFIFLITPLFFELANKTDNKFINYDVIEKFKVDYLNGDLTNKKYLELNLKIKGYGEITERYYMPTNEHKDLIQFLSSTSLIKNNNLVETIPLQLNKKQLNSFKTISIELEGKTPKRIKIDDIFIKGKPVSLLKKVFFFILSGVFITSGFVFLLLTIALLFQHIVYYRKTGKTMELPNAIDVKTEGFKFIFRGFKNKTNVD